MTTIRLFKPSDTPELIALFKACVHTVCKKDYTPEQLAAWAPLHIPPEPWEKRFLQSFTLVAEEGGVIQGFANLENDGALDMLYVSAVAQKQGIAKELVLKLNHHAKEKNISRIHADVSITAKPFFLKMGFQIEREYTKNHQGIEFKNFLMSLGLLLLLLSLIITGIQVNRSGIRINGQVFALVIRASEHDSVVLV